MAFGQLQLAPHRQRGHAIDARMGGGDPVIGIGYSDRQPLVLSVLRRRWWLLVLCALVSVAMAAGIAWQFSKSRFQCQGALLYTSLPVPPNAIIYTPDGIDTSAALLTSQSNLERLIEKHGLGIQPTLLQRFIHVQPRPRTGIIDVVLLWGDRELGLQMLQDLMDSFIERVAQRRADTVAQHIRHLDRELASSSGKVDVASEKLQEFQKDQGAVERRERARFDRELAALTARVDSTRVSLEQAHNEKASAGIHLDRVAEKRAELLRTRKDQLWDDLEDQHSKTDKFAAGSRRDEELKQAARQAREQAAKLENIQGLSQWNAEWLRIANTMVLDKYQYPAQLVFDLDQDLGRLDATQSDLELSLATKDEQIAMLKTKADELEKELENKMAEIPVTDREEKGLAEKISEATFSRREIQMQLNALRQLERCTDREFSISSAPFVANDSSNSKTLFLMILLGSLTLLSAPVFFREYVARRKDAAHETSRRFGLPVLARRPLLSVSPNGQQTMVASEDDTLRLLALRIQQSIPRPGSTVLFSGLDHDKSPLTLISQLARCFAQREERVLVLDATMAPAVHAEELGPPFAPGPLSGCTPRDAAGDTATDADAATHTSGTAPTSYFEKLGLSDYLSLEGIEPADIIFPSPNAGVDCILGGSRSFPREGLATRRMTELFDYCKTQYSLILVAGPPSTHRADLQMLAARADGILFTVAAEKPLARESQEVLQELLDLDAPIIGVVC